ncbi:hypothetical protein B0H15DRAFT_769275 [Mycena belliarum]|uniref:Protein kinase domain-containing protein n=1 Tax=Mycena belliarum TaxID=1033014 RepID=A0AAD6XV35_9AGAR|nr:hypothetical protein B0H15DRAFT_769275 [Mycena belliae]
MADHQLRELKVCEMLRANPHRNICAYHGYLSSAGQTYVGGLCFDRHAMMLGRAADQKISLPADFLDGPDYTLMHLHRLDYAHNHIASWNDINPKNLMLSLNPCGAPVCILIDFDSCQPLGERLEKGPTPDWVYPGDVSVADDDLWALGPMRE